MLHPPRLRYILGEYAEDDLVTSRFSEGPIKSYTNWAFTPKTALQLSEHYADDLVTPRFSAGYKVVYKFGFSHHARTGALARNKRR